MTRREQILSRIAGLLVNTVGVGSRVYRSRTEPLQRGESAAIVVEPVADTASQNTALPTLDWNLLVRVAVIVRGSVPDQLADPIVQDLHSRIMADLTLGGYAMDVQPQSVSYQMVEADQTAGVIVCDYSVRYRTSTTDLTS